MQLRRFQAASLACASIPISLIVALVGDDPAGWFGSKLQLTSVGLALMLGLSMVAATGALVTAVGLRRGRAVTVTALAALVALCLRLSITDPMVGLVSLGWYAFVAFRVLRPDGERAEDGPATASQYARSSEDALGAVAILLTLLTFGYEISSSYWVIGAVLLVGGSSLVMSLVAELPEWTTGRWSPWLLAGWGAGLAGATLGRWSIAGLAAGIATRQGVVLARRHLDRRTVHDALNYLFSRPAQMFALSFALVISAGALVLSFPVCSATGHAMRPVDALFTSVSAVCVTGLATIDVPVALTFTGQLVLLVLIQIGGLGVITLSSFAAILLSHRLGLRHESALGALVDQPRPQELARLVRFIVLSTIAIELLGALALWGGFALHDASRPQLVWVALFHSVSAFCNAGFSLQSDSLVAYQSNAAILVPIGVLVLLGGLGFPVMAACGRFVLRSGGRMAVHVRMVLWMTLVLLAGGALAVLVLEWDNTMAGQSWGTRLLSAGFQSVTLRTAGFNSLPVGSLRSATLFLMMIWMFIGGNSGSTAGGIKVTTVAVLLAQIRALLRGRDVTEVFGRQIPHAIVQRAAAVAVLGAASIGAGQFLLLVTQPLPFDRLLFEVVSAAGTVGLSADVTTQLDVFGKLVVIALMYTGRIGPLMLLLTLREDRTARLQAPMENVPVG